MEETKPNETIEQDIEVPYTNRASETIAEGKEVLHIALVNSFEVTLSSCTLSMDQLIERAVIIKEHFFNGQNKKSLMGVG